MPDEGDTVLSNYLIEGVFHCLAKWSVSVIKVSGDACNEGFKRKLSALQ